MLITTHTNVKQLLNIDSSDNDVLILAIANSVSQECESYMRRCVEAVDRTEYFDVSQDQQVFELGAWPVSALKAYNDYDRAFAASTEISASELTFLGNDGNLVIDRFSLVPGSKVLKVVYTGGLAGTQAALQTAYPSLEMAVRIQAAFVYEKRNKLGVGSEAVAGSSVSIPQKLELLQDVKDILDGFRRQVYV